MYVSPQNSGQPGCFVCQMVGSHVHLFLADWRREQLQNDDLQKKLKELQEKIEGPQNLDQVQKEMARMMAQFKDDWRREQLQNDDLQKKLNQVQKEMARMMAQFKDDWRREQLQNDDLQKKLNQVQKEMARMMAQFKDDWRREQLQNGESVVVQQRPCSLWGSLRGRRVQGSCTKGRPSGPSLLTFPRNVMTTFLCTNSGSGRSQI
ncbi:uncharacterized protein LOC110255286 isoform X15 [Sus scrofa]|uniref:uncharacterized protein LOC110255286 isoform X15 n=1 Tax=Sus scrofa TaxID=9823 RepID=UPI000A2B3779|nr:uncharacterized protein LOC110255286 isoform X15 [Sus scrofa]